MSSFVLGFQDIGKAKLKVVGGKGANLGELCKIEGIHVLDGFCISTEAFKKSIRETLSINELLDQLSLLKVEDRDKINELSGEIRRVIEEIVIPEDITKEVMRRLSRLGKKNAYAIRSSATAEDYPTASFAGQHDTYLNIIGKEAILKHISKCWASLYSERAVTYRLQNGFDHRKVYMSVVVQKMVSPQVSGIMFTADPVTSNRKILSIDAGFGLGEALVSGLVNADNYKVGSGRIIDKKIAAKKLAIYGLKDGGTVKQEIEPEKQNRQVLTDEQILQLEHIGRKIEKHFSRPQDIEWCLSEGLLPGGDDTRLSDGQAFYIVQAQPITTLFPIPEMNDSENHVYISVGHQQMMTDAMRPLGLSVWQLTAARPMYTAGGRLFVDVAPDLASPARREVTVNVLGKSDPLIKDAFMTILERKEFIKSLPNERKKSDSDKSKKVQPTPNFQTLNEYDPTIVLDLMRRSQAGIEKLKTTIQTKSRLDLIDFILEDIQQLKKSLSDPQSFGVIMTAMNAASWINEKMKEWLGEKNAADTLSQSVANNITSEMGLALLDVADVIRPYPELIEYLEQAKDVNFPQSGEFSLDEVAAFDGGQEARDAIKAFLNKYGMRCAGEIDITRTRWSEKPDSLIPMILNNIKNIEPGAGKRKFERGQQEALKKEQDLLERLKKLPDGEQKAKEKK